MSRQPPDGWNDAGPFQPTNPGTPGGYQPSRSSTTPSYPERPLGPAGYLQPPAPNYPPYPPQYGLMVRGPRKPEGSAVAVEAILALFGVYGVGWLMSGITTTGAVIMSLGFVWDALMIVVSVATLGIGALCLVPMHFLFVTLTTVILSSQVITD